ncbi:hypothetical protein TNCV_2160611 [Trichonephila clavipes]|nr:hypothetical protein TNCV_2160611 [Trichonephila clavipes]
MDDNARNLLDVLNENYLQDHNLDRMEWSAQSPDLNPIEHISCYLGRHVGVQLEGPYKSWNKGYSLLPISVSDKLTGSMETSMPLMHCTVGNGLKPSFVMFPRHLSS